MSKQDSPLDHLLESIAVSESSTTNTNVLLQSEVLDLMQDSLGIILGRTLVLIRLDGADVGRLGAHKLFDQGVGGALFAESQLSRARIKEEETEEEGEQTLILSLAVGGRFFELGSGRSGKRFCKNWLVDEPTRSSKSLSRTSLFLSVIPATVYMTSPL